MVGCYSSESDKMVIAGAVVDLHLRVMLSVEAMIATYVPHLPTLAWEGSFNNGQTEFTAEIDVEEGRGRIEDFIVLGGPRIYRPVSECRLEWMAGCTFLTADLLTSIGAAVEGLIW
mmetsp:Transcript_38309/g.114713  ORF Transcript_38309/g.114713 Transcript_38309/m.114713 type:complete len:116 (+) Transcript_38309:2315-2662(+)